MLNRIPKILASRASRLGKDVIELDYSDTDVSGYKSILSRDAETGEVLSLKTALPPRIALNNELGALVPNYPLIFMIISIITL